KGLLVTEFPGTGGAGQFTRLAGVPQVVVAGPAEAQVAEDPAQRRVPEPAHGPGGELKLAGVAGQVALPLELALDPAQGLDVVHGLPPEGAPDRLLDHIVHARAQI